MLLGVKLYTDLLFDRFVPDDVVKLGHSVIKEGRQRNKTSLLLIHGSWTASFRNKDDLAGFILLDISLYLLIQQKLCHHELPPVVLELVHPLSLNISIWTKRSGPHLVFSQLHQTGSTCCFFILS